MPRNRQGSGIGDQGSGIRDQGSGIRERYDARRKGHLMLGQLDTFIAFVVIILAVSLMITIAAFFLSDPSIQDTMASSSIQRWFL